VTDGTYDGRATGPRYHVSSFIGDQAVAFQHPIADPFVRHTVFVHWWDLVRALLHGGMKVTVQVGGDRDIVDTVLNLDTNVRPRRPRATPQERRGLCECCARIVGRTPGPAVARWEGRNGSVTHLCRPCLDHWRQGAQEDGDLAPASWQWLPRSHRIEMCLGGSADEDLSEYLRKRVRLGPEDI
jgi:hypothetical protein